MPYKRAVRHVARQTGMSSLEKAGLLRKLFDRISETDDWQASDYRLPDGSIVFESDDSLNAIVIRPDGAIYRGARPEFKARGIWRPDNNSMTLIKP